MRKGGHEHLLPQIACTAGSRVPDPLRASSACLNPAQSSPAVLLLTPVVLPLSEAGDSTEAAPPVASLPDTATTDPRDDATAPPAVPGSTRHRSAAATP